MTTLAEEIGILLKKRGLTLGTVESATGGLISHLLTNIPGSSDYFQGSIVSYSNEIKMRVVGVKKETLEEFGAVSAQVAEEMAAGGRRVLGVDICIADTGIAGPGGAVKNKPVGLFYIGLSHSGGTYNRRHLFQGNRLQNKEAAAVTALTWVKEFLTDSGKAPPKSRTLQVKEVVTCFLEADNKILILRRSSRVGTYQGRWGGVSGYVEKTPDEQALIEIREETGLTPRYVKLISRGKPLEVIDEKINTRWIVHPYLFRVTNPAKIKIDWEHTEIKWISPEEIDQYPSVPRLKEALQSVFKKGL
jgi:nicotinamide-nucleotide amidase